MNMSLQILTFISFILFIHQISSAQVPPENNSTGSRGDDLEIKLVTIGPGDDLTSWWGHTAIIVEDHKFNVSRFYNYGLFSFEQENPPAVLRSLWTIRPLKLPNVGFSVRPVTWTN